MQADLLVHEEPITSHTNASATSGKFVCNICILIECCPAEKYLYVSILEDMALRNSDVFSTLCRVTQLNRSILECGYLAFSRA